LVKYRVIFGKQAQKDKALLRQAGLEEKAKWLLDQLSADPFFSPPPYEKLRGNLQGYYSRRINIQHRIVYEVFEDIGVVRVLRMWTHYQ